MKTNSVAHWNVHVDSIVASARQAPRAVAYLHLPKTGGSSIHRNISSTSGWSKFRLPLSFRDPKVCVCGGKDCRLHRDDHVVTQSDNSANDSFFLKFGHERYTPVRWILDEIARAGVAFELVTSVRPVRQRLVSMFTDYWTQVFTAERYHSGEIDLTTHRLNVVSRYLRDSAHYRDGRVIDGKAWFRAFRVYGAGVPFLLSEVFDGSTSLFRDALESGALRVIPSSQLDEFLFELTGRETFRRSRVSVSLSTSLRNALEEASSLIDEIVDKEAPYDHIIAEHLGNPNFIP